MRKLLFICILCLIPLLGACTGNQASPEQAQPDQAQPDQASPDQASPDQAEPEQESPDQAEPEQESPEQLPAAIDFEAEFMALLNSNDFSNYFLPQQIFDLILAQEGLIADEYILSMMVFHEGFSAGLDAAQVLATLSEQELKANAYSQYMAEGDTYLQTDSLAVAEILDGKLSEGMAAYINLAGQNPARSIIADAAITDWNALGKAAFEYYDYLQKYPDHLMAEVAQSLFNSYWDSYILAFFFDNSHPYDYDDQIDPQILESYQYILANYQELSPELYADLAALLAAWQANQGLHDNAIQDLILLTSGKYY